MHISSKLGVHKSFKQLCVKSNNKIDHNTIFFGGLFQPLCFMAYSFKEQSVFKLDQNNITKLNEPQHTWDGPSSEVNKVYKYRIVE